MVNNHPLIQVKVVTINIFLSIDYDLPIAFKGTIFPYSSYFC